MREARLTADLPERFAYLYHYQRDKFDTPLDSRGIADIDAVFELAIRTYPDELPPFQSTERNKHHLYWPEDKWKRFAARQTNAEDRHTVYEFRTSAPQIAYVPIPIHKWIERVMIPPPPPSLEVMRRRNAAWTSATMLLKSAYDLDQARTDYKEKKHNTRRVLGQIAGITPVSKRRSEPFIDETDGEYWLSELNSHLQGWWDLAKQHDSLPVEDRFLPRSNLEDARKLRRRIREGAIVPLMPEALIAA